MENNVVATVEREGKDWINELPDVILSYIFSFLTIKDAAESTSFVCRRWRDLWKTRSPDLELDIANIFGSKFADLNEEYERYGFWRTTISFLERHNTKRMTYIKRVEKILELLSCNKLDSFRVAFWLDQNDSHHLDKWVRFAIEKGAQKLDLRLSVSNHSYVFAHGILTDLNSSTLKSLSLYQCVLKPPTDFDRFVRLTTLRLHFVEVDSRVMSHMFFACSLLESLTLKRCGISSDLIIGPSLHLHDLKALGCHSSSSQGDRKLRIKIDAVNLSSLEYFGYEDEILMKTPKLVTFCVGDRDPLSNVLTQLTFCPELSSLHLQIRDDGEFISQNFPAKLKNLKQVKLDIPYLDFEFPRILDIIRAAPFMEELIMTFQAQEYEYHPYYDEDMNNLSTFSHDHLRRVKMQLFQDTRFEIDLAICILKIAAKLELLVIDPHGSFYDGDGMWDDNYGITRSCTAVQGVLKDIKTNAGVIILSNDKA